jgi:hypothetical protein
MNYIDEDSELLANLSFLLNQSLFFNFSAIDAHIMADMDIDIASHRHTVVAIGSVLSVCIILSNLVLIITIMADRRTQRSAFVMLIVNLCVADLIVGAVVMPLAVSYAHRDTWLHGEDVCMFWSVIHILHYTVTALALVSISINRVVAKVSPRTLAGTRGRIGSVLIAALPWLLGLVVGIPLILSGHESEKYSDILENVCFFILEKEVQNVAFGLTHIAPVALLLLTAVVMLVFYSLSGQTTWQRLAEDQDGETGVATAEVNTVRMSTAAACLANVVTAVMWSPFVVQLLVLITCTQGTCHPHFTVYTALYMLAQCNAAVSPYVWLLCPEIRGAYKDMYRRLATACSDCRRLVTRDTEMSVNFSKNQDGMVNAHLTQT